MNDTEFDKHFTETQKTIQTGFKLVLGLWVLGAVVSLSLLAGLIYVAVHFLGKVW